MVTGLVPAPSPFFRAPVPPCTEWGRPAQPPKSCPALRLPGGILPGVLRTCPSPISFAGLPIPQMLTGQAPGSGPATELLLWFAVGFGLSLPYIPTRGWQAPGGPEGFPLLAGPPVFPHGRVPLRRHKLQRVKSRGETLREKSFASSRRARYMGERGGIKEIKRVCACACVYVI